MKFGGLIFLPFLLLGGCFYIAPIEEEPDPEDVMPSISVVSPGQGVVEFDLSSGGGQKFVLSGYDDENAEQALYHRLVLDFRPAGVTSNAIVSTVPRDISPDSRDAVSYLVRPCAYQSAFPGVVSDGHSIDLYFLLSDDVFRHQNDRFQNSDFSQPFETQNGRGSVWVEWTVLFRGTCPE